MVEAASAELLSLGLKEVQAVLHHGLEAVLAAQRREVLVLVERVVLFGVVLRRGEVAEGGGVGIAVGVGVPVEDLLAGTDHASVRWGHSQGRQVVREALELGVDGKPRGHGWFSFVVGLLCCLAGMKSDQVDEITSKGPFFSRLRCFALLCVLALRRMLVGRVVRVRSRSGTEREGQ